MPILEKHGMQIIESQLALVKKFLFPPHLILIYGRDQHQEKNTRITLFIIIGIGSGIGVRQKLAITQHMK